MSRSPIENANQLLEKTTPLTSEDKALFGYFGVNAKILPPLRILNPQNVFIGDVTSIREGSHINAFKDLSFLLDYVDPRYQSDFRPADYRYESRIEIGRQVQIGRFCFMSCTRSIRIEDNVVLSERVFVGDNNHTFSHPHVPIVQQPNQPGDPLVIGHGCWIGVGAAILAGTRLGRNCVVGANAVCRDLVAEDHSVIGTPSAQVLYRRHSSNDQ